MAKRYEKRAEIEAQGDGYRAGLEAAAKIAETWSSFVKDKWHNGDIKKDEFDHNHAAALTIARKIRQHISPANEQD